MALSIVDIFAASYPAVLAEKRKAANQWGESALLNYMEKHGFVKRESLGSTIEIPLDYVMNAGGEFLETDTTATSVAKTSVLGSASYAIAEVSVPVTWSKKQDAMNPSKTQKVNYTKGLMTNAIDTHDQLVERALLAATATQGFLSVPVLASEDGTGTIGGIVAGTDTFWKNQFDDYDTGADGELEASLTTVHNACAKGTGGVQPSVVITSADGAGIFESKLQAQQRWANGNKASMGFKFLQFKGADVVFSNEYSSDSFFFANAKNLQLIVSKEYFRHKGQTQELEAANAYNVKIYSALQLVTSNRSRLGVSFT